MEPFSAGAAAIALVPIVISTGRAIHDIAKNVKYARREIRKLACEMNIFAESLVELDDILRRRDNTKSIGKPGKVLIEFSKSIDNEARRLLRSVQPLASNPRHRHSVTEVAGAYVKWYTSKSAVNCIRAMLRVARESINSLTNIHLIRQMDRVIQMLRAELSPARRQMLEEDFGMTIEELQRELPQRIRCRRIVRHQIDERLREAQEEVVQCHDEIKKGDFRPNIKGVVKLTRAVDTCTEHLLPKAQSGRRSRILDPIQLPSHSSSTASTPSQPSTSTVASKQVYSSETSGPSAVPSARPGPTRTEHIIEEIKIIAEKQPPPPRPEVEFLNPCDKCRGTCIRTEEHQTPVPQDDVERCRVSMLEAPSSYPVDVTATPKKVLIPPPPVKSAREEIPTFSISRQCSQEIRGRAASLGDKTAPPPKIAQRVPSSSSSSRRPEDMNQETGKNAVVEDAGDMDEDKIEDASEEEEQEWREGHSPFHPLFGIKGKQPRGWKSRD